MLYLILTLIFIIFICLIYIFFKVNKLKDIKKSLVLCEEKINEALSNKYKIVVDILEKLNDEKLKKYFVYTEDLSLAEREKSLFDIGFKVNKNLKENKTKLKKFENEMKELNTNEETLDGLKDFYNANVLNYNEVFYKKYFNKIYKLLGFTEFRSFKIRKLEEYEIFKL